MRFIGLIIVIIIIIVVVYNGFLWASKNLNLSEVFYLPSGQSTSSAVESKKQTAPKIRIDTSPKTSEPTKSPVTVTPPQGFTVGELSPHYRKVRITSVYPSYSSRSPRILSLRANLSGNDTVEVSGWRLKNNKNSEVVIPQAMYLYNPFSFLGNQSDIILSANHIINVYFPRSPLGKNLRLNKCTGYLNNNYETKPSFPNNCPSVKRSEIASFPGECQSFILSLRRCEEPTSNELNSFTSSNNLACHDFLGEINYRGCYNRYSSDADFLSREWRVWLNKGFNLDSLHDRVLLFDEEGLLVNEYIY